MSVSLRGWSNAATAAGILLALLLFALFTYLAQPLLPAWAGGGYGFEVGSCTESCATTGCAENLCLPSCQFLTDPEADYAIFRSLPFFQNWKEKVCRTECQYYCLLTNETKVAGMQQTAAGFHEDWCLARVLLNQPEAKELYTSLTRTALTSLGPSLNLINEPASAILCIVNLVGTLVGLARFLRVVLYKLPTRPITKGPYYPLAGFWTMYGVDIAFYWFCQCIFHRRTNALDENINSTIDVVVAVFSLLLAVLRIWDIRSEQGRVIVLGPMVAFLVPHLMYTNMCTFDYGLILLVRFGFYTAQYLLWVVWAGVTKHPAKAQLWLIAAIASCAPLLKILTVGKLWGTLDVDTLWILSTVPSTFLWWNFLEVDAVYMTSLILKKRDEALKKSS